MGNKLFHQIVALTGLPPEEIGRELKAILKKRGLDPDFVTLDQLREVLAAHLCATIKGTSKVDEPTS